MCSWRCRNEIYANRKRLPFIIFADLTDSRQKAFAKLEKDKSSAQRVIQFVFVDENCKFKLETKSSKYYAFSTINEFLTLLSWLDDKHRPN